MIFNYEQYKSTLYAKQKYRPIIYGTCLSIFLSGFLVILSCNSSRKIIVNRTFIPDNCIIAHRGAWKHNDLPENSIASLKRAIQLKCYGSEFDVRMTADDSLVITHDTTFNGLPVEKTNYTALERFKLRNGEKLPTLRNYILAGLEKNTTTKLVCEIKPSTISMERGLLIATKVYSLMKELKASGNVIFISFSYNMLKKIKELDPNATVQYLYGNKSPEQLHDDGIDGADYYLSIYKDHPEWIETARKINLKLNAWTVDDAGDMDWLLANDFNYITTNEPELVFERIRLSPATSGWKLTWSDEFNYIGLPDSSKWDYNVGGHGWGNNEKQWYTHADTTNAMVKKGKLFITALKQSNDKNPYTSARLVTKDKAWFMYGRIEVSAKLPPGRGTWPAIWMLGKNSGDAGWPLCGEIDIMEHVGYDKDSIHGTVHTMAYNHLKGTQKGKAIFLEDPYTAFHRYVIEWTPEKIDFFVDAKRYNHFANEHFSQKEWPFDQPFYLILNLAIGGGWGGRMGIDEQIFPAVMEIEYVRVFQK